MARPVTLCTGQWADMTLCDLAAKAKEWGYDGLELACWGDHFEVAKAAKQGRRYTNKQRKLLEEHELEVWAISAHLAGQMVLDKNDGRSAAWGPPELARKPAQLSKWAVEEMMRTAKAAQALGVGVVNGFTGSPIWHLLYSFPPVDPATINKGFDLLAERWGPILDVFSECGVKFALEVHPTEIAFDIYTAERALSALGNHEAFGFNFDPSHLQWQGIDPVVFLRTFPDRIFHVHMKDCATTLDGKSSILSSHLDFGDPRRGWDFRSLGRGDVDFEEIIRALNAIEYSGPLSVEWEDCGMDREAGAVEACQFVKEIDFEPSRVAFDAAFEE